MNTALTITGIYLIGFFITLTIFKLFGKLINDVDYDSISESDRWYDEWESNNDFYIGMSMFWFITVPIWVVAVIIMGVCKVSKWYLDLGKNK